MPSWMFKEETKRGKTKKRDPKKKPAKIKKNDNRLSERTVLEYSHEEWTTL